MKTAERMSPPRQHDSASQRWSAPRVVALLAAVVLLIVTIVILVQALRTTPCDNVHFRTSLGTVNPSSQPPPIGRLGVVRSLRQFFHGGSAAVFCDDFPDPFVLRVGHSYYAYATNTANYNIPVLATHGFFGTGGRRDALSHLPGWADRGWTWAPSVLPRGDTYVLYYAARVHGLGRDCLSVAVATSPLGPFVDQSSGPLICPPGGAIDPSPMVAANGQPYLVFRYNNDIVSAPLRADGLTTVGPPTRLIGIDQAWEGDTVEGPSMIVANGRYYLFYSGNRWDTGRYAINYAVCASPSGPCVKASGPWLASGENVQGPGRAQFFTDPSGQLWMSLHAWVGTNVGYPWGARDLFVLKIGFLNGAPVPA